ncbi:hypothetical protein ODU15_11215, partial [Streptococcus suis]
GTFCIYLKRLHNLHGGFTHYRNYRALFFYTQKGSIISTVDLPTTEIIEPYFILGFSKDFLY